MYKATSYWRHFLLHVSSVVSGSEISFMFFRLKNPTYDMNETRHKLNSYLEQYSFEAFIEPLNCISRYCVTNNWEQTEKLGTHCVRVGSAVHALGTCLFTDGRTDGRMDTHSLAHSLTHSYMSDDIQSTLSKRLLLVSDHFVNNRFVSQLNTDSRALS